MSIYLYIYTATESKIVVDKKLALKEDIAKNIKAGWSFYNLSY